MLRSSLRSTGTAPISLFAFQDIIFSATGIFLLIAILMTLFGKIDMISTESLKESENLREQLNQLTESQIINKRKMQVIQSDGAVNTEPPGHHNLPSKEIVPENIWLYDVPELLAHNSALRKITDTEYQHLSASVMEMNRKEHRLELLQAGAYQSIEELDMAIVREGTAHDFREPIFITLDSKGFTITYPGRVELNQEFEQLTGLLGYVSKTFSPKTQSFLIHVKPSGIQYFESAKSALRNLGYSLGYEPVIEDFLIE